MRHPWIVALTLLLSAATAADTFIRHPKQFRVGPNPTSIAAADFNGDGLLDIITTDRGRLADTRDERPAEDSISFLLAQEPLVYSSQPPLRAGFGPYQAVIANIDQSNSQDILVANFHAVRNRDMTLLRSIGDNLFEPIHFTIPDDQLHYARMNDGDGRPLFPTPGFTSLLVDDLNGDGLLDAVLTGWSADVIVFIPGAEEGFFGTPVIMELEGGPRHAALGDLDGDGKLDLAVTLYSANEVALLRGNGKGRFEEYDRFDSRGKLPHRIDRCDINKDGYEDLVVTHAHADDSVVIFYGDGDHHYPVSQEILLGKDRYKLEFEIRDMLTADFTENGRIDIALACRESSSVVLLRNTSTNSDIPQTFSRETYTFKEGRPNALCIGDFNNDDKPDLGVALTEVDEVALLLHQ